MLPRVQRLAPPRFLAFLATFIVASLIASQTSMGINKGVMIGFDVAAALFLLLVAPLLRHHDPALLRAQAARNDANRTMLLIVTGITMTVILTAIAFEYNEMVTPRLKLLVVGTLALAWLFSNSVYALHYAHLYYRPGSTGGLQFAGDAAPDYGDFFYFAFTLGMTFQTSDTAVTTPQMRRVVTAHSIAAFVFNIGVLAFTINVLGGRNG
jgi:uncharacterized membrane protein